MSNVVNSALLSITLLASLPSAFALDQINCESPNSTMEINFCAGRDYEAADHEFGRVYTRILTKLDAEAQSVYFDERAKAIESKRRLILAQDAWEKFMSPNVELHGIEMLGGTGETASRIFANTDMIKSRTQELRKLFLLNDVGSTRPSDFASADAELNRVYKFIMAQLNFDIGSDDPFVNEQALEMKRRLIAAQRAWIPFRDANANMHGAALLSTSGEARVYERVRTELTIARTQELKRLFQR